MTLLQSTNNPAQLHFYLCLSCLCLVFAEFTSLPGFYNYYASLVHEPKDTGVFLTNTGFCSYTLCHSLSNVSQSKQFSPFGVKQVSNFLVVNFHVGDLHSEALSLLCLLHSPVEQGATEPRNQTRLLH